MSSYCDHFHHFHTYLQKRFSYYFLEVYHHMCCYFSSFGLELSIASDVSFVIGGAVTLIINYLNIFHGEFMFFSFDVTPGCSVSLSIDLSLWIASWFSGHHPAHRNPPIKLSDDILTHGFLTLQYLMSTKRSHIIKQTCSWKLQVCLSMCDLSVDTCTKGLNQWRQWFCQ